MQMLVLPRLRNVACDSVQITREVALSSGTRYFLCFTGRGVARLSDAFAPSIVHKIMRWNVRAGQEVIPNSCQQ